MLRMDKTKNQKKICKILGAYTLGIFLLSSTILGTISLQATFAQPAEPKKNLQMKELTSLNQSSAEGSSIVSDSPKVDVVKGKKLEVIENSFIVELKAKGDTGILQDVTGQVAAEAKSVGGKVSDKLDKLGFFTLKFGAQETPSASELGNASSPEISGGDKVKGFIDKVKGNSAVQQVYPDALVEIQAQVLPNDQNRVDADRSQARSGDGMGAVNADIGIIDTGVQRDHPDLNVFRCVSFIANPPNIPLNTCNDGHGHGTHVAGTAAAKDDGVGVVGKAPGARIWAMKVLSDSGSGSFSDILEALNYVAANSASIEVINLSLGGEGTYAPVESAITNLVSRGVVVVVAAANAHKDANGFTPARTPAAITVSAEADSTGRCGGGGPATPYGPDDSFASFSNYGRVVDIAAPGVQVFSTYKGSGYATMSGTSMAAPNVAGAAALYKSITPSATPAQVDAYLKSTGTKAPPSGNPLVPCDGNGRGYFTFTQDPDGIREPLLYMASQTAGVCPSGPLTGVWKNNDGGLYYIKQCGGTLWWAGLSNNGAGTGFTNVFKGTIPLLPPGLVGKNIVGDWCDVPRGTIMNCGVLTVKVISSNQLQKVSATGGFGGSVWTR